MNPGIYALLDATGSESDVHSEIVSQVEYVGSLFDFLFPEEVISIEDVRAVLKEEGIDIADSFDKVRLANNPNSPDHPVSN